jgi:outer membrane receptor for ferrienterochelin and colicins
MEQDTMRNKLKTNFLLFPIMLLTFFCSGLASAESGDKEIDFKDLSLEEMITVDVPTVEGASKFEQIVTEAPSSVSIVTSSEIRKLGYRTLADILESLRGFDITYDRNYSYSGVRGYGRPGDYNDKILLLIDGHRINDNITNQAPLGTEFSMDIDLIDRIEIIRGPGSSLYGNNAFFAVIDVHTKSGKDLKGTEMSAGAGSYDTYKSRVTYGNEYKSGFEEIVSGTLYHSRGQNLYYPEYDSPSNNNGVADHLDQDEAKSAFTKFSYHGLTLESSLHSRTKDVPTGSFGADFNQTDSTVDSLFFTDLKYEKTFGNSDAAMARFFYDYYSYTGDAVIVGVENKDIERGERIGGEIKYSGTVLKFHKIVLGGEYRKNIKQQQVNYDLSPFLTYIDDNRTSQNFAFYFQDEFSLSDQLILNAGVRYDDYDTFGSTINPRIGVIYNPIQKSYFKLLYGSAFRAPNVYELYYTSPSLSLEGNPDLKPETIQTYEAIYDQYMSHGFKGSLSFFYYKINDLITQIPDARPGPNFGYLIYQNIDEVVSRGIETELTRKTNNGIEGRFSYSYQVVKDGKTDADIPNSPKHLAKANLIFPLYLKKVFLGIEESFTSEKLTYQGFLTGSGSTTDKTYITNLTLSSRSLFVNGLDLSGSIYNLFNLQYSDPGRPEHLQDKLQQDGINYRITLTYLF